MTKQQLEDNYILKDHSSENLRLLGFHRYSLMCDEDSSYYIYRFPVEKYLGKTVLECELKIDSNTGNIRVDVYDMDHDVFAMFYNEETESNKSLLTRINKNILAEYKKLGIVNKSKNNKQE